MTDRVNFIFLHGGPGFSDYLKHFFHKLDDSSRLIFYDQLKGPNVTIDNLVQQLEEIVNSLEGKIILVGHSWGATLGIEYASRFELKLSAIIFISSGLSFNHWKIQFDLEKENRGLKDGPPEKIFLSNDERGDWKEFLDGMWETFSDETFDSLYEGYVTHHDLTYSFSKLQLPILNVFGSEDIRFPARITRSIAAYNPKVENFEVEGAGHFPFLLDAHRIRVLKKIIDYTRE